MLSLVATETSFKQTSGNEFKRSRNELEWNGTKFSRLCAMFFFFFSIPSEGVSPERSIRTKMEGAISFNFSTMRMKHQADDLGGCERGKSMPDLELRHDSVGWGEEWLANSEQ